MSHMNDLKNRFDTTLSPTEEQELWNRIAQRRAANKPSAAPLSTPDAPAPPTPARALGAPRPAWSLKYLAPLSIAVAASAVLAIRMRASDTPHALGPLHLQGTEILAEQAIGLEPREVPQLQLEDGSSIVASTPSQVSVLENSARDFTLKQASGRVHYAVTPGGPRRWRIECQLASVEVVGTDFTIEDSPNTLWIKVDHGIVLVRGEQVDGRVQRLVSGQELRLEAPPATLPQVPARAVDSAPTLPAGATRHLPPPATNHAPTDNAREASSAERSEADLAWEKLDAIRTHGDTLATERALVDLLAKHPSDRRAALAAFMLARLRQDTLHHAKDALQSIELALKLGLPSDVRPDAEKRRDELRCALDDHQCAPSTEGP